MYLRVAVRVRAAVGVVAPALVAVLHREVRVAAAEAVLVAGLQRRVLWLVIY